MKYYDITVPISDRTVTWPNDPPVKMTPFKSFEKGDRANVLRLEFGTHTGSHVDSPSHFGMKGTVDRLPLESLIGPAQVVAVKSRDIVRLSDIRKVDFARVKRVLFKTRNSSRMRAGKFFGDFVAISLEVAKVLKKHRVRLVGIDAMSVDPKGSAHEVHHLLLAARTVLLENINLSKVPSGQYELICLPLKVTDGDGAPARVVLIRR